MSTRAGGAPVVRVTPALPAAALLTPRRLLGKYDPVPESVPTPAPAPAPTAPPKPSPSTQKEEEEEERPKFQVGTTSTCIHCIGSTGLDRVRACSAGAAAEAAESGSSPHPSTSAAPHARA